MSTIALNSPHAVLIMVSYQTRSEMFAAVLLEDYTGEFLMLKLFNSSDDCNNWVEDRNQTVKGGYWKVVDEDEMM